MLAVILAALWFDDANLAHHLEEKSRTPSR
jgi:hypothetical protein